jgi:hypothetical protein
VLAIKAHPKPNSALYESPAQIPGGGPAGRHRLEREVENGRICARGPHPHIPEPEVLRRLVACRPRFPFPITVLCRPHDSSLSISLSRTDGASKPSEQAAARLGEVTTPPSLSRPRLLPPSRRRSPDLRIAGTRPAICPAAMFFCSGRPGSSLLVAPFAVGRGSFIRFAREDLGGGSGCNSSVMAYDGRKVLMPRSRFDPDRPVQLGDSDSGGPRVEFV